MDVHAEFKVSLPFCLYTGSSPQAQLADTTTLSLPFKALADSATTSTKAAVSVEYVTADTAL